MGTVQLGYEFVLVFEVFLAARLRIPFIGDNSPRPLVTGSRCFEIT